MGEFIVSGDDAFKFLQYVVANDLERLNQNNMALYTQFVMPDGGTVDDLIVYRREGDYLLVVNASNIEKDWQWLKKHAHDFENLDMQDISHQVGLLALQGPNAATLLAELAGEQVLSMPAFTYGYATVGGVDISFGRTGYTGEDGFEIFVGMENAEKLWDKLLDAGAKYGIEPCGLGARDTLRLEAALPLYGHELGENISPLESGLSWSVKLDKGNFLGRQAMLEQKANGLSKQCVCLKADGKALPRQGYPVFAADKNIGVIASGSQGIFLGYPIAFAFVPPEFAKVGQKLTIGIRDSRVECTVVSRPFYKRAIKK